MATGSGPPGAGPAAAVQPDGPGRPGATRLPAVVPPVPGRGVLTVPNAVSAARLACVPVFVVLVAAPHRRHWFAAAVLLAVLGATDWIDGQLARRLGQVSPLGKVLDPTADRILLAVAACSIVAVGAVPAWVAAVTLTREALVAAGTLALAAAGARRIEVIWLGKAGTFLLMCAMPLFLTGHAPVGWHRLAETLAWVAVVPGMLLGWAALARYALMARAALAQGRRRAAP